MDDEILGLDAEGTTIHEGDTVCILSGFYGGVRGHVKRRSGTSIYVMIGPRTGIQTEPSRVRVLHSAARLMVQ